MRISSRCKTNRQCGGFARVCVGRRLTWPTIRRLPAILFLFGTTIQRGNRFLRFRDSGVVQSVARQPLELVILVRVQAPEPYLVRQLVGTRSDSTPSPL